ncbi:hypothetical protein ENBRE01_0939 [Enteropsectra breve]|nr:hypothetical protein ENBRE01_0939 [Enteropsectra breve]
MDLSQGLESCGRIISSMKQLKSIRTNGFQEVKYTTKRNADALKAFAIQRAESCLHSLKDELESYAKKFDTRYFTSIENREVFVNEKMQENSKLLEENQDQIKVLREIEMYEDVCSNMQQKIKLNKQESMEIIRKLHGGQCLQHAVSAETERILRMFIELDYESVDEQEKSCLEKALQLCADNFSLI